MKVKVWKEKDKTKEVLVRTVDVEGCGVGIYVVNESGHCVWDSMIALITPEGTLKLPNKRNICGIEKDTYGCIKTELVDRI